MKCKARVLAENTENAKPKNLIVEDIIEDTAGNEQLSAVLEDYKTPVIKKDERLGEFVLNKRFNRFDGKLNLLGRECKISLNEGNINDCDI